MNAALRVVDLVGPDQSKKYEPAGRMAIAIIELTQKNGGCLPQDLNAEGFSPDEVATHWHMAKSLADVELKLMSKRSINLNTFLRSA
jgi:hypothetical protein